MCSAAEADVTAGEKGAAAAGEGSMGECAKENRGVASEENPWRCLCFGSRLIVGGSESRGARAAGQRGESLADDEQDALAADKGALIKGRELDDGTSCYLGEIGDNNADDCARCVPRRKTS